MFLDEMGPCDGYSDKISFKELVELLLKVPFEEVYDKEDDKRNEE